MARITLDIPKEKMQVFLMLVMQLGVTGASKAVASPTMINNKQIAEQTWSIPQKGHPYYDWDFFSNELEFE